MTKSEFAEELLKLKYKNGLCQEIDCTEEENVKFLEMIKKKQKLPTDILQREDSNGTKLDRFYRIVALDISKNDFEEYCVLKQTQNIQTIKKCVVFFTVLTVVSLFAAFLLFVTQ